VAGVLDKIEEEIAELREALQVRAPPGVPPARTLNADVDETTVFEAASDRIEDELGDLFFSLVNFCRHLRIDPERALRGPNRKFERRFRYIESRLAERGRQPAQSDLAEMDRLWDEAKRKEVVEATEANAPRGGD
jgi:NTP pyrophosphatase (non-canonical NTP hydrolase)